MVKNLSEDKNILPSAFGAGVGLLLPFCLKRWEASLPQSPFIQFVGPQWGRWCALPSALVGGCALAIGAAKKSAPSFTFGVAILVSSILNGLDSSTLARYQQRQMPMVTMAQPRRSQGEIERLRMGKGTFNERLGHVSGRTQVGRPMSRPPKPEIANRIIRA